MPDAALTNATARREAIAAEINALQQRLEQSRRELALVDEFIARWHTYAGMGEQSSNISGGEPVDVTPPTTKRIRPINPSREVVGDVVESLLREWNRPATRKRLFSELGPKGIHIQGTDPEMVFSTMLWRMKDRFERHQGKGYWLKGEPIPGEQVESDLSALLGPPNG